MTHAKPFRVGVAALTGQGEDVWSNIDRLDSALDRMRAQSPDLVLLPELSVFPWFISDEPAFWADQLPRLHGPLLDRLRSAGLRLGATLVAPIPLIDEGTAYNAAEAIGPSGELLPFCGPDGASARFVAKLHLPPSRSPNGERAHFAPGRGIATFLCRGVRVGVLICFDRRFPECWRALRRLGADIALVPVGGPGNDPSGFFEAEMRTHAKENRLFALSAARSGHETRPGGTIAHEGASLIAAPDGLIVEMLRDEDVATIDLSSIETERAVSDFPALVRADVARAAIGSR